MVEAWLEGLTPESRPDVIVLSNALLLGLAASLRRAAGCPVVCWLQDEHVWIDAMAPDLRAAVLRVMAAEARAVDVFVAVSAYYAGRMTALLGLDAARLRVVFPGLDPAAYTPADMERRPATVGFLSRLSAAEGFDRFVEAYLLLRRDPRFADVRLAATGGPSPDRGFLKRQRARLAAAGALQDADISADRFVRDRFGFLSGLTLLCVPGSEHEAFGYYTIEALAAGVPVVLPNSGAAPEILDAAGCGTRTADAEPATLARAWAELLDAPDRLRHEAACGRAAARARFSREAAAEALETVLAGCVGPKSGRNPQT